MSSHRIVIVGAGPAGLAAARAYREHGGSGEVTMLGKETLIPYRRPPLTKEFLRGELDANELPIESPDWFEQHDIELHLGCEASAIDPSAGTVTANGRTLRVDAIVLATGADSARPDLPGLAHPRVRRSASGPTAKASPAGAGQGSTRLCWGPASSAASSPHRWR